MNLRLFLVILCSFTWLAVAHMQAEESAPASEAPKEAALEAAKNVTKEAAASEVEETLEQKKAQVAIPMKPNPMRTVIAVDEFDNDMTASKNRALKQAQMRGLWQVLTDNFPADAKAMFALLSAKDVAALIDTMTITDEIAAAGRYQANVVLIFDEIRLRALKRQLGSTTATGEPAASPTVEATGAGTLLIIPAMQSFKGDMLLWQPENAWRAALNRQTLKKGKGKLIMPFGDPTDALTLDPETVLAGDVKALQSMAARYGSRSVVIALAKMRVLNPKATMFSAEIFLRRAGASTEEVTFNYETEPGEAPEEMLTRAAADVASKLGNSVNQFSIFEEAEANRLKGLVMRIEYPNADTWLALRKYMESMTQVSYLEVGAVSPEFTQATLYFKGEDAPIKQTLQDLGAMVDDSGAYWVVKVPPRLNMPRIDPNSPSAGM